MEFLSLRNLSAITMIEFHLVLTSSNKQYSFPNSDLTYFCNWMIFSELFSKQFDSSSEFFSLWFRLLYLQYLKRCKLRMREEPDFFQNPIEIFSKQNWNFINVPSTFVWFLRRHSFRVYTLILNWKIPRSHHADTN